jgi:hypothetical protein
MSVLDVELIGLVAAFFVAMWFYVALCART